MTNEETAWLAGWLEGEGHFSNSKGTPRIAVCATDLDIMQRAAKLMGIDDAKIRPKKKVKEHHKQAYRIDCFSYNAKEIMTAIRPYMGERRGNLIDKILSTCKTREEAMSIELKKRWSSLSYREKVTARIREAKSLTPEKNSAEVYKGWETRRKNPQWREQFQRMVETRRANRLAKQSQ